MPVELTAELQDVLDRSGDEPLRVVDPRTRNEYVLLPAARYEDLREIEEDDRIQRAVRQVALRNAVRRAEDEP